MVVVKGGAMTDSPSDLSMSSDDGGREEQTQPSNEDTAGDHADSPATASQQRDTDSDVAAKSRSPRRVSLSVRTLVVASAFVILLGAVGVMTWLYFGERAKVEAQVRQADNRHHAEQIALDYAVNAATMNFQDLNTWKGKLVNGTTPELHDKLTKAATQMEQLLVPLEWNSTSQPLVAKVLSDTNGVYVVDTFVSVLTKTTQAPDNLQSTATYSITIDSNNNWQISDVGGIGAVVGAK